MKILIATTPRDLRLCRICLASVRHFHPQAEIALLPGAPLPASFLRETERHFGTSMYPVETGDYGWGFVKLEPLFRPSGESFLVLDADTVLTGPVLHELAAWVTADDGPDFLVDEEEQSESDMRRLYYDWDKVRTIDASTQRPAFVFNSGQWAGRSGVLARKDFEPWVEWTFPRRLKHPELFMPGDQGILNYILNQKAAECAVKVVRIPLMRWPGHGLDGLSATAVAAGSAPARVIHWAGMKHPRLRKMAGADLLAYYEERFYESVPWGGTRRRMRAILGYLSERCHRFGTWIRLFWKYKVQSLYT